MVIYKLSFDEGKNKEEKNPYISALEFEYFAIPVSLYRALFLRRLI